MSRVTQVCVNVDPANLIAEVIEGNNNACGDFSRMLDSDGLMNQQERWIQK